LKAASCEIYQLKDDKGSFESCGGSDSKIPVPRRGGYTDDIKRNSHPVWIGKIEGFADFEIKLWDGETWQVKPLERGPKTLSRPSVRRGVKYALGLPITIGDACVGVAWVRYQRPRLEPPTPASMSFALGCAAAAGLVLDSIARRGVDLKERTKIQSVAEQIAREITERWQLKDSKIIEAHVESRPFQSSLGGDFWAGRRIDHQTASILLADFQGHGVAGALYMLPLIPIFESAHDSYSAAHVLGQLVKAAPVIDIRATAIYAIFMVVGKKKWLVTSSAGHMSLIVFQANSGVVLQPRPDFQGSMIGSPAFEHPLDDHIELNAGDIIVGYTDGVADETTNRFNRNKLTSVVHELLSKDVTRPEEIAKKIMERAERAYRGFKDDATLFVARVR
jgi:hypothetical protein